MPPHKTSAASWATNLSGCSKRPSTNKPPTTNLSRRSKPDNVKTPRRRPTSLSTGGGTSSEDLTTGDFEAYRNSLATSCGIVTLGNEINRTRIDFKYY